MTRRLLNLVTILSLLLCLGVLALWARSYWVHDQWQVCAVDHWLIVHSTSGVVFVFDNHFQVAKFLTIDEHLIVPEMLVFSKKTWDTLPKDDQALITKFSREAQQEERVLWEKYEKDAMDKMKKSTPSK